MLAAIRRGDRIVTGGGIIGTVNKVIDDNEVLVEIAEGVRVRVHKPLISTVIAKTEAAPPAASAGPGEPANDTPAVVPPKNSGMKRFLGGKKE